MINYITPYMPIHVERNCFSKCQKNTIVFGILLFNESIIFSNLIRYTQL